MKLIILFINNFKNAKRRMNNVRACVYFLFEIVSYAKYFRRFHMFLDYANNSLKRKSSWKFRPVFPLENNCTINYAKKRKTL